MPKVAREGRIGVYVELPVDLRDRFKAFCKGRGEDFAAHVRQAMERHMAYPPPLGALPPLPDSGPVVAKKGRPKKLPVERK